MEALQYALVENLHRCDLNPVEETEAILQLLELRLSSERAEVVSLLNHMANRKRGFTDSAVRNEQQQLIESVFQSLGRLSPESFRTHRLPLLNLPPEILAALTEGRIEWNTIILPLKSKKKNYECPLIFILNLHHDWFYCV